MDASTLGMGVLIVGSSVVMVIVVALGLYRGAGMPEMAKQHRAAAGWVNGVLVIWLLLAALLGAAGFFAAAPFARVPRVSLALLPLVAGYGLFWLWPAFRQLVMRVPVAKLIGVQLFRVLGGVFLIGYAQGRLPAAFALPAGIGDILIGLLAPLVAAGLAAGKNPAWRYAVAWNIAGLFDLVLAVTLGVLSAPGPAHLLALDTPNTAISAFPFVLIPTLLVPLSILLHLFALHALAQARSKSPNPGLAVRPPVAP